MIMDHMLRMMIDSSSPHVNAVFVNAVFDRVLVLVNANVVPSLLYKSLLDRHGLDSMLPYQDPSAFFSPASGSR